MRNKPLLLCCALFLLLGALHQAAHAQVDFNAVKNRYTLTCEDATKEELITKLIAYEVNKLNMGDGADLNQSFQTQSQKPKSAGPARFHERKASRYKQSGRRNKENSRRK